LGWDIVKRVDKINISISADTKMFGNWRQIVSIKDADYCAFMKDKYSQVRRFIMQWKDYLQGILHDCPYENGQIRIYNYTDTYQQQLEELDRKSGKLPADFHRDVYKGEFRLKLQLNSIEDPNGIKLMIQAIVNFRQADGF